MLKTKSYYRIKFRPTAIKAASKLISDTTLRTRTEQDKNSSKTLKVEIGDESWNYDTEPEFYADYIKNIEYAHYELSLYYGEYSFNMFYYGFKTDVSVKSTGRSNIENIFNIFEDCIKNNDFDKIDTIGKEPVVFIGHGTGSEWRDLKDHLDDKHGYKISAYEVGARAGHAVRDVLDEMANKSTFAILVMSADDKTSDDKSRARQNVIHEMGLFQGKLGFSRAIALIEKGVEVPSNVLGITWIPYEKGHIDGTYGDIIATINREFYS